MCSLLSSLLSLLSPPAIKPEINVTPSYTPAEKTDADVKILLLKDGRCDKCRQQTCETKFKWGVFGRYNVPQTIPGFVLRGRCLLCNPMETTSTDAAPVPPPPHSPSTPLNVDEESSASTPASDTITDEAIAPSMTTVPSTKSSVSASSPASIAAAKVRSLRSATTVDEAFEACEALGIAARDSAADRNDITRAGGIPVVVDTMESHVGSAGVQEAACCAFLSLTLGNPDNRKLIGSAGGVPVILKAMRRHTISEGVQMCACWALAELSSWPSNMEMIRRENPRVLLEYLAKKYPSSCRKYATLVLTKL